MLSVHRIFQLIFSIIVSAMLLYFLITYAGNYGNTQDSVQKVRILKAFAQDVNSVYLTGIPINFTNFRKYDFSSCMMKAEEGDMPEISCAFDTPGIPVETPLIFYPGSSVYIGKFSMSYGWWSFGFVEAVPDTVFIFNPVENTGENWQLIRDIVEYLPDTSSERDLVKIKFGLCSGNEIVYGCGGMPCSKKVFYPSIDSLKGAYSRCTAALDKNMRLITISSSCNQYMSERDVCINPNSIRGVGSAYIKGSGTEYAYRDMLDLVALSIGGGEKDDFGTPNGERIYEYKNSVFLDRIYLAARVMSNRALQLSQNPGVGEDCRTNYALLSTKLDTVYRAISAILIMKNKDYIKNPALYQTYKTLLITLNDSLNVARSVYNMLLDFNCERSDYGT